MKMTVTGKRILDKHKKLGDKLVLTPESREINFYSESKNGVKFGKPRFSPAFQSLKPALLRELMQHLQSICSLFDNNEYYYDDLIAFLIQKQSFSEKGSIAFLLQHDVWETDEVYGLYLIDIREESTEISYYRRKTKYQPTTIRQTGKEEIEEYILNDAIKQIKRQFSYYWSSLEERIVDYISQIELRESFPKTNEPLTTNIELKIMDELKTCYTLFSHYPEIVFPTVGRIAEYILLIKLGKKNRRQVQKEYGWKSLAQTAFDEKVINQSDLNSYSKIFKVYNDFKHDISKYNIFEQKDKIDPIQELITFLITTASSLKIQLDDPN